MKITVHITFVMLLLTMSASLRREDEKLLALARLHLITTGARRQQVSWRAFTSNRSSRAWLDFENYREGSVVFVALRCKR